MINQQMLTEMALPSFDVLSQRSYGGSDGQENVRLQAAIESDGGGCYIPSISSNSSSSSKNSN
jgi:hypothetical protein